MIEYTVYECKMGNDKFFYNLYKHDLNFGDFYLASFRRLDDLRLFIRACGVDESDVFFSNVLRKDF